MKSTQRDRVLAAARRFNGVCATDFQLPDVCDDGPPILRVAARLYELDQEGYVFECIGKRDKCKVFRFVSGPEAESGAGSASAPFTGDDDPAGPSLTSPALSPPSEAKPCQAEQGSLFGVERRKGEFGFASQEAA